MQIIVKTLAPLSHSAASLMFDTRAVWSRRLRKTYVSMRPWVLASGKLRHFTACRVPIVVGVSTNVI